MALECVEGADVAGMSDERGRRACGAAGFVRAGRRPDPARLLRRDRFSSASRSVRRGRARLPGSRDGHLCTRPAFPRESNGAVVGLTQKCRVRCAEAVRQWGCSSADAGPGSSVNARQVSLRCSSADAGSGPLLAPGAVVGLEQECSRRRGYQRQILEEAEDTLGMPASAGPPVRAGRPRGSPSLSRVAFDASGAGGTTPPPTGSSPGARAASLCSTAPGPRDTLSLIVNIPDRRRPARRRRPRDEGSRDGTDLEPELNRS